MQAMKKSKKKPAAKSAPEKAKKTKQVKEEQNEKQPLLKTLIFGEENRTLQSWKPALQPYWIFCLRPPWTPKAVTTS